MRIRPTPYGRPPRNGTVTPLLVLSLSLFVGMVALCLDGGTLMEDRRHVQAAADAAALAAAADLFVYYPLNRGLDWSGTARAAALANAAANGFSNNGEQSSVAIHISPQIYEAGPYAGQPVPPGYVEVIIQYNAGRLFSGIFGSGTIPVRSRAVARGQWTPNTNALLILNLTARAALNVRGNANLTVYGNVQVNSNSPDALNLASGGLSAASLSLNSAAGINTSTLLSSVLGLGGGSPSITTSGPIADPLRFLAPPNPTSLGLSVQSVPGGWGANPISLYPGIYNGGIRLSGNNTYYLHDNPDGTPGIYYLNGQNGFQISGSAQVMTAPGETGGVMIYNNWADPNDSISVTGNASLTLIPPASGPYQGISIFQARGTNTNVPSVTVSRYGKMNVSGTIYAAHATVDLSGNGSGSVAGGQIIADTVSVGGNASFSVNPGNQPIANMRILGLVQ
jgi:hypothetical protein